MDIKLRKDVTPGIRIPCVSLFDYASDYDCYLFLSVPSNNLCFFLNRPLSNVLPPTGVSQVRGDMKRGTGKGLKRICHVIFMTSAKG